MKTALLLLMGVALVVALVVYGFEPKGLTWTYTENPLEKGYGGGYYTMSYNGTGAQSAIWKIAHGGLAAYNVTLPDACIDDIIQLRVRSAYSHLQTPSISYGECFDGSGWMMVTQKVEQAYSPYSISVDSQYSFDGNWDTCAALIVDTITFRCNNGACMPAALCEEGLYVGK